MKPEWYIQLLISAQLTVAMPAGTRRETGSLAGAGKAAAESGAAQHLPAFGNSLALAAVGLCLFC